MTARFFRLLPLLIASACSSAPHDIATVTHPSAAGTAAVTIRVVVPAVTTATLRRTPAFVSPAVRSISVSVSGSTSTAAPTQIGNCTDGSCVETVDAPFGSDSFAVALYDAQNGGGNLLGSGVTAATIVAGTNASVLITFNPVVANASVSLGETLLAGMAASIPATVSALDPSGATIVAPGSFEHADGSPLTLAVRLSDPNGSSHVSLNGQTSQSGPAPSTTASPALTIAYDGTPVNFDYPSLIVADASTGTVLSTAVLPVVPHATGAAVTLVGPNETITSTVLDGAGAIWFTATGSNPGAEYGRYVPSTGAVTVFPLSDPSANPNSLVSASDGDLYFFEHHSTSFGQISASGTLREFAYTADIASLTPGVDGKPWFITADQKNVGNIATAGTVATYAAPGSVVGLSTGPNGKMWFLYGYDSETCDLDTVGTDGSFGTPVMLQGSASANGNALANGCPGGLVFGPGAKFYAGVDTAIDYPPEVYSITTGGAMAFTCAYGSLSGTLSDGALLYEAANIHIGAVYSAIRADGSCIASSRTSTDPFLSEFVEPIDAGRAYGIADDSVTPFAY